MNRETYTMEILLDVRDLGRLSSHTEAELKYDQDGRLMITMELRFQSDQIQPVSLSSLTPWTATKVTP